MSHTVGSGTARNRLANMNDFKAPHEQAVGSAGNSSVTNAVVNANNFGPTQPKKRRKTASSQNVIPTPTPQDLLPPPPTSTFGDTIVASNPFDDTPTISASSAPNSVLNGIMNSHMPPVMGMHMNAPPHMHHSNSPPHMVRAPGFAEKIVCGNILAKYCQNNASPNFPGETWPTHSAAPEMPPSHISHTHGMPQHPGNHHQMHPAHPMHSNQPPSSHMHPNMAGPGPNLSGNGSPLRSIHQMNNSFGLGHPIIPDSVVMQPHVNNLNNRMTSNQMSLMNAMPSSGGQMNTNINSNMSSMNPLGQLAQMGVGPNAHLGLNSPSGARNNSSSPNMAMNSPNICPNGNRMGSASPNLGMNSPNVGANGTRLGNSPLSTLNNIGAPPMSSPILQNAPNGGMPPMKNNGQMGPPSMNGNAMPPGMAMMPGQAGPRMNLPNGSPISSQMMPMPPHSQQQQQQMHSINNRNMPISPLSPITSMSPHSTLSSHSRSSMSPLSSLSSLSSMVGGTGPVSSQSGSASGGGGLMLNQMSTHQYSAIHSGNTQNSNQGSSGVAGDQHMQQHSQYPPSHLMQHHVPNMPPSMQHRALQQPPSGPMQPKGNPPIGVVSPFTNPGPMSVTLPQQGPMPTDNHNPLNSLNAMSGAPLPQSSPCLPNNNQMSQMPPNGSKPIINSSEKIYPPNQPIVFNPQNPSAPPIYACGMCHKEINDNDEGILCEFGCNFFYHR